MIFAVLQIRIKEILLTNSTGSALKQLMPVALRAGRMTEDTLVFQHKLCTRTGIRGFASNKSDTEEKDKDRGEAPHGFTTRLSLEVGRRHCFQRRSVRAAAGTLVDR